MKANVLFYQRILLACLVLFIIIALVIILGIIPPAKADTYPGINHEIVSGALWIISIFNLLSAFSLILIIRSKKRIWESKPILIIIGLLVLILGLVLADGASEWRDHGSFMQSALILVCICATVDFLVGITVITMAFLMPKKV